jgi:N4-gp56 family major capsid protein
VYYPTGMDSRSTGLAHQRSTYYTTRALDQLRTTFRFPHVCKDDQIPKRNGRSIQWFRWDALSAQVTPSVDGTIPTSGTISNNVLGAELSQFSAFISASSLITDTSIDPLVEEMSDQLGYQAGQTVDRLTRDPIDAYSGSVSVTLYGTYPTAEDIRAGGAILDGMNAVRFDGNDYEVILHPYTMFDIVNDPSANGYADMFKYTKAPPMLANGYNPRAAMATSFGGYNFRTTTNVKVTTGSPNTYRMYMFSKDAIGKASLEGWNPSYVTDPLKQNFNIHVIPGNKFSIPDPTAEIGGMVSYKFAYVAVLLDGPWGTGSDNYRYRIWDCPTKLGL